MFLCCFLSCKTNIDAEIDEFSIDKTLRLNNGKKWKASGSMTYGMTKINEIIDEIDIESFDPKLIGYKLDSEIRMMMSICGATGEAHDQFHYYLDPLKEQINGLRIANEIAKEPLLTSIKIHLDSYKNYFN